jgi:hypothetical protein
LRNQIPTGHAESGRNEVTDVGVEEPSQHRKSRPVPPGPDLPHEKTFYRKIEKEKEKGMVPAYFQIKIFRQGGNEQCPPQRQGSADQRTI